MSLDTPPDESIELGSSGQIMLAYAREWPRYVVEWSLRQRHGDSDFPVVGGCVTRDPDHRRSADEIWNEARDEAVEEARAAAAHHLNAAREDSLPSMAEEPDASAEGGAAAGDQDGFGYKGRAQAVETARLTHPDKFWVALEQAYPRDFWEDFDLLKQGDVRGLESAVRFLEADPWFFGSGYVKERLIRYINRVPLTPQFQARLQQAVPDVIQSRDRREFRRYCRLARKVQGPGFQEKVASLLESEDPGVRRRAGWVLDAIDGKTKNCLERDKA